jgi:hypothetical protein
MKLLFTFILLPLQILIAWPAHVYGNESPAGIITKVEGKVTIIRNETNEIGAEKDAPLHEGDTVITDKSGKAWFSLKQGHDFHIAPDTQVEIDELSSIEFDDNVPSIRLILGYLWSKISKPRSKPGSLDIHTPTAVIGIRGTEFDTVVSLDTTTAIAVDEGTVEVEFLDRRHLLGKDKMVYLDTDVGKVSILTAIPKTKRDWNAWRKERIIMLYKKLPGVSQVLRDGFQKMADGSTKSMIRLKTESKKLDKAIDAYRKAQKGKRAVIKTQALNRLKTQADNYTKLVKNFRKQYNRVKVIGKSSENLIKFLVKNKNKFSDKNLNDINSNLLAIGNNLKKIKVSYAIALSDIRKTYRKLYQVRQEIAERGE